MALSTALLWLVVVGSEHLSKSVSQFSSSYPYLELINISVLSRCSCYSQLSPQFMGSVLQNFSLKAPRGHSSPWVGLVELFSQSSHWYSDCWSRRWQSGAQEDVVILKWCCCVVSLLNKDLNKEGLCCVPGVPAHWKCDQETNNTIAHVLSCFLCLVQIECYQTWLFCLQKNIREQWTARGRWAFVICKKSNVSITA